MLRRRWPILALAAWSAFVWCTRISNAWNDVSATTATKVGATALSLSVLVLAVAAVAVVVRARSRAVTGAERRVVQVFAGWTIAVWIVRAVEISLADYSTNPAITNPTGFKVVHVVLGLVSIGLAALSWRAVSARSAEPVDPAAPAADGPDGSLVSPGPEAAR